MNLISQGLNARLDSLAACMLLWSGAISFDVGDITWDGKEHHVTTPTIHDDVIGLYRVPRGDVEEVMPDVLDLMRELEADEELRVPASQVADGVRCALPAGDLTGMGLFLLQGGSHPLIFEPADKEGIRVRYEERLARGIPALQRLLCRLAMHLRSFRGDLGDFTVQFIPHAASRKTAEINDFDGCVPGGTSRLDARVTVHGELLPQALHAGSDGPSAQSDSRSEDVRQLAAIAFTLDKLSAATRKRVSNLEEAHTRTTATMPDPNAEEFNTKPPSTRGTAENVKASRSLAIRSAFYIAIGVFMFLLGQQLATGSQFLFPQIVESVQGVIASALSSFGVSLDEATQAEASNMLGISSEYFTNACRIVGVLIMTLGIVIPVWRILRHKKKLDRELSRSMASRTLLLALSEKYENHVRMTYESALAAWAADIEHIERERDDARKALKLLDGEAQAVCTVLDSLDEFDADAPTSRLTERAAADLVRRIEAEPSEERRYERVAAYCQTVDATIARVRG